MYKRTLKIKQIGIKKQTGENFKLFGGEWKIENDEFDSMKKLWSIKANFLTVNFSQKRVNNKV